MSTNKNRSPHWMRTTLPLALSCFALFGLLGLAGCTTDGGAATANAADSDEDQDEKKKDDKKETAVPVEVATLGRGDIESVLRFSTNLYAENQVEIHAQAARLVRQLNVEEGDVVKLDQVLLRLQDEEQRSAHSRIKNQYDRSQRDHLRLEQLHKRELVSEQVYTDSIFEHEQQRIALEDSEREVSYTEVRASIAGTITNRLVNVGDLVTVGQHLFDVVDFDSLTAPVYVPEKELMRLKPGLEARISSQAIGAATYSGTVKRIAPIVDPRSGTVKVLVALAERQGLRPGMYVDVALVTDTHRDAILVPKRALIYDKDQVFVYRLNEEERRVERVLIQPILADKDFVEPLGGLEPGDQLVVAGQAGLKPNALVRLPGDPIPEDEDDEDKDNDGNA